MKYSWLFILPLFSIIAIVVYSIRRFYIKRYANKKAVVVANSKKIRSLPEYEKARVRYRVYLALMTASFVAAIITVTISASRPISVDVKEQDYETRDIMLCVDMSASTDNVRENILNYLSDVVTDLKGQRLGITIFATKSASLSPLTNDYASLENTLETLRDSFIPNSNGYRYSYYQSVVGTTSAIGNGVLSCINNFDQLQKEGHSQSIVIATDNEQTEGEYTLKQAANYAKRYGITLYGINTAPKNYGDNIETQASKEFRRAIAGTGGIYFATSVGTMSTTEIVDEILRQEAIKHESEKQYVQADSPAAYMIIAAASIILFLVLAWRINL